MRPATPKYLTRFCHELQDHFRRMRGKLLPLYQPCLATLKTRTLTKVYFRRIVYAMKPSLCPK